MVTSAKSAVPTVTDQAAAMQLGQCAKNLATCLAELRTAAQKVPTITVYFLIPEASECFLCCFVLKLSLVVYSIILPFCRSEEFFVFHFDLFLGSWSLWASGNRLSSKCSSDLEERTPRRQDGHSWWATQTSTWRLGQCISDTWIKYLDLKMLLKSPVTNISLFCS